MVWRPDTNCRSSLTIWILLADLFKDAHEFIYACDRCQQTGNILIRHEIPLNTILEVELLDVWGLILWFHFHRLILVAVDYVSKWVEDIASPTNDSSVVKFLKKYVFDHFRMPWTIISDEGKHFWNKYLDPILAKYGVTHRMGTSYHPQMSEQVEI